MTREFAIAHLRTKRDNLEHAIKRYERLALEAERDAVRYAEHAATATLQVASIDELLEEVDA